jgi:hypothetical protein
MWSSMQGVAATLSRGHLLALRHEFSDDGNTEAQGLSDPPLFLLQIKRFTMVVLLVSFEAGELASSKGRGGSVPRRVHSRKKPVLFGHVRNIF